MCVTKSSIQTETVSVFQLAKNMARQFQSSATNSSGDGAITSWVSHHLNTIYFLNWSFFFQITSFGHVLKVWTSSLYILKWQKIVLNRNIYGYHGRRGEVIKSLLRRQGGAELPGGMKIFTDVDEKHLSNEKRAPGCLWYIGGYTTQLIWGL